MILTKRDFNLLLALKKYELLSTAMIEELIFTGVRKTTILKRLRILEKDKLIYRFQNTTSQIYLWSINDLGAKKIGIEANKNSWNKNTLEHDLKLINFRLSMERLGLVQNWTTEQEIKSMVFKNHSREEAKKKLIPDGLFISSKETQNKSVAVELEMTLKDKNRIKEVLKNYLEKKDLSYVWYVSPYKSILKSVFLIWKELKKGPHSVKLIGSLYEDVITNSSESTIFTLGGVLKFPDFWKLQPAHSTTHTVSTLPHLSSIQNLKINVVNYSTISRDNAL